MLYFLIVMAVLFFGVSFLSKMLDRKIRRNKARAKKNK